MCDLFYRDAVASYLDKHRGSLDESYDSASSRFPMSTFFLDSAIRKLCAFVHSLNWGPLEKNQQKT